MKKLNFRSWLAAASLLLLGAVAGTGCLKETDCTGVITVINRSSGQPVVGAVVTLDCGSCVPPGNLQTDQQTTDASGKTNHVFKYPAVLDINITSSQGSANGVIKLEEGETTQITIYLN